MKRFNAILIIIIMIIAISLQVYGKTHVLIIGNGDYEDNAIQDLPGALEDARQMKETLIQLEMANEQDIQVNTNLPAMSLKIKILEFLKQDYDKNDRLIFYYSGHGYSEEKQMDTNTYLVPANTIENYRQDFLVNLTDILKENIDKLQDRETLILLDACYSGSILKDPDKGLTIKSIKPKSLLKMIEGTNINILVASGAKETAKEETGKGGYFTKYLIEGLKGKANEDANEYIDFKELSEYVRKNVVFASNNKQQPEYSGNEELIITEVKEQIIDNIIKELSNIRKQEQLEEELFNRYINILSQTQDKDTAAEGQMRASLIKFYKDDRRYDGMDLLSLKAIAQMLFPNENPNDITDKDLQRQQEETNTDQHEREETEDKPRQGTCYLKLIAANEKAKGAQVYIDEEYTGTLETGTILIERLTKATHTITIDGETIEREEIEIIFDNDYMMVTKEIEAQSAKRKIIIITEPSGATVDVNGQQQNEKTPVMIEVTIEQEHHIRLTKDGYLETELTVREETKGEPKRIETTLTKASLSKQIRIETNPTNAAIYINEQYKGKSPLNIELQEGTHNIEAKKEGYITKSETKTIGPQTKDLSRVETITFTMEKETGDRNPDERNQINPGKLIMIPETSPDFQSLIQINKGIGSTYSDGEKIEMKLETTKNAYFSIYDILPDGSVHLLFPNNYQKDNYLKVGDTLKVPYGYKLNVGDETGREYLLLIASSKQFKTYNQWNNSFKTNAFYFITNNAENNLWEYIQGSLSDDCEWTLDMTYFFANNETEMGTVAIDSDPDDAKIWVDGRLIKKTTPYRYTFPEGYHYVKVKKQGYESQEEIFYLFGGSFYESNFKLEKDKKQDSEVKKMGTVKIYTTPKTINIIIDGKYYQFNSGQIMINLSPGSHELLAVAENYHTMNYNFELLSGEFKQINLLMERKKEINNKEPKSVSGSLTINTDPDNAIILIEGKYYDNERKEIFLKPGVYEIIVAAEDHETKVINLQMEAGVIKIYNPSLTKVNSK